MDTYKRVLKGELSALRIAQEVGDAESDKAAFNMLEESFYNEIGYGEKFHRLHELKNKKALLEAEYVIENKKFNINLIRIKAMEIEELEKTMTGGMDIDEAKAFLDKKLGYSINMKSETIKEFYTKLRVYGRN
jgi:hypothetical protein